MTLNETKNCFASKLPDYFDKYYDEFNKSYDRSKIILEENEIKIIKETTNVSDDFINALKDINEAIYKDDLAHYLASYFVYVTIYKIYPWENLMHSEDVINLKGFNKETINLLFVSKQLAYSLIKLNPPKDLNIENINAYVGYSSSFYKEHGYYGISPFHWNMQCAGGCMFLFNTLKFCPSYFCDDFPIITNGKEYVTLTGDSWFINKDHFLTGNEDESIGKTSFYEDDNKYVANVINKDGTVQENQTTFLKNEWKNFLRGYDDSIDIHIPSDKPYNVEEIKKSIKEAIKFYKNYYPKRNPKAIVGYSWIFSPELKFILNDNSNIMKVQNFMHIIPTLGTFDENIEFVRPGSSLQSKIKECIANGHSFHFAIMYIPISDVE